jgi:hypothetical protein
LLDAVTSAAHPDRNVSLPDVGTWARALTVLGLAFVTVGTGIQAAIAQAEFRPLRRQWQRTQELEFSEQVHPAHRQALSRLEKFGLWISVLPEPLAAPGWYFLSLGRFRRVLRKVQGADVDQLTKFSRQATAWTFLLLGSIAGLAAACISLATPSPAMPHHHPPASHETRALKGRERAD